MGLRRYRSLPSKNGTVMLIGAKREARNAKRLKPYCCLGSFNCAGSDDVMVQGAARLAMADKVHIHEDDLELYHAGHLEPERVGPVEVHLSVCRDCRERLGECVGPKLDAMRQGRALICP